MSEPQNKYGCAALFGILTLLSIVAFVAGVFITAGALAVLRFTGVV